jgi:primary-amine oxidase
LSVWYTLNYHHMPRPEDWPVQPVVYAGFHWMPVGFFDQNPALDVPHRTAGEGDSCCA